MSLCIKDKEGHLIECNALKSAVDKFLSSGYPMVQLFHSNIPIGKVIPSFITEDGKVYKTHVDNIAAYAVIEMRSDIEVSHKAMEEICKGNLRAFSISGNSSKKHPKCTENGCYWSISDLEIYECTICQDPVNPGSYFDIVQFPSLDTCPNCQAYKEVAMKPLAESMAAKALQKNQ